MEVYLFKYSEDTIANVDQADVMYALIPISQRTLFCMSSMFECA